MSRIGYTRASLLTLILAVLGAVGPVYAAPPPEEPPGPIYTVQPGDTLLSIALQHDLKLADLILTNNLFTPLIFPGQQLQLPGVPPSAPPVAMAVLETRHTVQPGETVYAIAEKYGVPAGSLALVNNLADLDQIRVGQVLQIPASPVPAPDAPTAPFQRVTLSEAAVAQGRTLAVSVSLTEPATLGGQFEGQPLLFTYSNGQWWAITAIHALLTPGDYPLVLTATRPDGSTATHIEVVTVAEGDYGWENIQLDSQRSALLDAELLAAEREKLVNQWTQVSPLPRWDGPFWYPVAPSDLRVTSYFGTRRTYNNSAELSFHSGADFGGTGIPIYAPAAGTVVLAEPLTVRGNAVLIDHGLGLYSGYWHQSNIAVVAGQEVRRGDLIGYIGGTGLVTGPHLHWEVRLNGIAVDPLQWVQESIP